MATNVTTALPLIAVTGATGTQGGSVARHLLETGRFRVRGLTRNPGSKSAKELGAHASGNLEVVRADLEDVDSLRGAFRGCYGVYAVTNCWEHGWDAETRHGKNMVDAARAEGCVRHFVWSTMEHSGELECWHFDSKARVNDYLLQSGLPRTSIYTAAYYENFEKQLRPSKQTDSITGKTFYQIDFNVIPPDVKFFAFCGTEIGAWISQVFLDPDKYIDHDVRLVVEWLTTREMAATASSVTGLDVRPRECTEEELVKTQGKGEILVDLYRMTKYYITHPPESGVRDQADTLSMFPKASTWENYVRKHAKDIFGQEYKGL